MLFFRHLPYWKSIDNMHKSLVGSKKDAFSFEIVKTPPPIPKHLVTDPAHLNALLHSTT